MRGKNNSDWAWNGSSVTKCLMDSWTHRAGTQNRTGELFMEAKVGITEGAHGMRRAPPTPHRHQTNSEEDAEVNGQVAERGTFLWPLPQPLFAPSRDGHPLPPKELHWLLSSSHWWKALPFTEPKSVSPYHSSFDPLDHAEQVCPLPYNSPASIGSSSPW